MLNNERPSLVHRTQVRVETKCRWKGVGVGEEELTKGYIKLVLAALHIGPNIHSLSGGWLWPSALKVEVSTCSSDGSGNTAGHRGS